MSRCASCGTPAPPPELIVPQGITMERVYSYVPTPFLVGEIPVAIPWKCRCGFPQSLDWHDPKVTQDLRHRAIEARVLRMMWDGRI